MIDYSIECETGSYLHNANIYFTHILFGYLHTARRPVSAVNVVAYADLQSPLIDKAFFSASRRWEPPFKWGDF